MPYNTPTQDQVKNLNRRRSIRIRCLDCSTGQYTEVLNCPYLDCPLYPYRTGRGQQNPKLRNSAIKDYCLWCSSKTKKEKRLCPDTACALHKFAHKKAIT